MKMKQTLMPGLRSLVSLMTRSGSFSHPITRINELNR